MRTKCSTLKGYIIKHTSLRGSLFDPQGSWCPSNLMSCLFSRALFLLSKGMVSQDWWVQLYGFSGRCAIEEACCGATCTVPLLYLALFI